MPDKVIEYKDQELLNQETYKTVRAFIVSAQKQVYSVVNSAMVTTYWNIGK